MSEPTQKQHYVPQFYMKRFADERGFLQVLDMKNRRLGRPRPYPGVCWSSFFYAVETGEYDEISQHIEEWLKKLENIIAKKLDHIIERIITHQQIQNDDRYTIAVLMSMLWLRTPSMREHLNSMREKMEKELMRFSSLERIDRAAVSMKITLSPKEKDELVEMIETGSYEMQFDNRHHLRFMVETLGFGGPGFANMFYGMKWKINIAKGSKRFITTDNPVVEWWSPPETFYGASFMQRNKYFAITPDLLLECTDPIEYNERPNKAKRKTLFADKDDTVSMYNILLSQHSHQFVYSSSRHLLDELLEGRMNPGILERTYYNRFQRPWDEYKQRQSS